MLQIRYKRWRHPCLIKHQPAGINTPSQRDIAASGGMKNLTGDRSFIRSSTFTKNKHFVVLKTNYTLLCQVSLSVFAPIVQHMRG